MTFLKRFKTKKMMTESEKGARVQELQRYRESPDINQTTLKRALGYSSPKDQDALSYGSLIDMLTLTPELLPFYYHVIKRTYQNSVVNLADALVERIVAMDELEYEAVWDYGGEGRDALILEVCTEQEYQRGWKDATKLAKLTDPDDLALLECIDDKLAAYGKTIVDSETLKSSKLIAQRANAFIQEEYGHLLNGGWTYETQVAVYFDYNGHSCKGLIDILLTSPDRKRIVIADLKTTDYGLRNFDYQMRKLRVDFQQAFYREGIILTLAPEEVHCHIIAYSTSDDAFDLIELTEQDLLVGKYGKTMTTEWFVGANRRLFTTDKVYGFHEAFNFLHQDGAVARRMKSFNGNAIWI